MTLGTHIVVGTTLAAAYAGGPASAFGIGLLSHYLMDAITHWDYPISCNKEKSVKAFVSDVLKVLIDITIGVGIVVWAMGPQGFLSMPWLVFAVVGSAFPDFLQFGLMVHKNKVLNALQRFHHAFHSPFSLNGKPIQGILFQVVIVAFFTFALM